MIMISIKKIDGKVINSIFDVIRFLLSQLMRNNESIKTVNRHMEIIGI